MPSLLGPKAVRAIFQRFESANAHPTTELTYTNPFTLLVAVVLSAQSTDKGVNKATPALFAAADTPAKMLELGEAGIREKIKTIGFYNAKAKNVLKLSKILVEKFVGQVPNNMDDLTSLPGVGRKTANVILNTVFGHPTIAVDTHIFRVSQRIGLAHGHTPEKIEEGLEKIIPNEFKLHAHHWLILHGRYICVARKPKCPICPIADICLFPDKTKPSEMKTNKKEA